MLYTTACAIVSGEFFFYVLDNYVDKRLGLKFGNMSLLKLNVGSNMFEKGVCHCSGLKIGTVLPLRPDVGSSTTWSNFEIYDGQRWKLAVFSHSNNIMYDLPRGTIVLYSMFYTIQCRSRKWCGHTSYQTYSTYHNNVNCLGFGLKNGTMLPRINTYRN